MIGIKKITLFLFIAGSLISFSSVAQEKLTINDASKHIVNWQFKSEFIGTTDDFAFYLVKEQDVLKFFKIDKQGSISKKVPIVLNESDRLKSASIRNFIIVNEAPVLVFKSYNKTEGAWKLYMHPLNDNGIINEKEATVIDEYKGPQMADYTGPSVYFNREHNQLLVYQTSTDKNNYKEEQKSKVKHFNVVTYDADLKKSGEHSFVLEVPGRTVLYTQSEFFGDDKIIAIVHTAGSQWNSGGVYTFYNDVDDYLVVTDLASGKSKAEKIETSDRKVVNSVLRTKSKIVFGGVTLQGDKHNYVQKQFVSVYDMASDKLVTKEYAIPDDAFNKVKIKLDKTSKLILFQDFAITNEIMSERDEDNFMAVLKVHKLSNGVDDNTVTELVRFDATLNNIKTSVADIKSGVTGFVVSKSKVVTFTIDKDPNDKSKKALIETQISNEGDIKEVPVYSFNWNDFIVYQDQYGNFNTGIIKNQSVIFELKKGEEGYFGTLDIE